MTTKAAKYADLIKKTANRPEFCIPSASPIPSYPFKARVSRSGNLENVGEVELFASAVPQLIKWLQETFVEHDPEAKE